MFSMWSTKRSLPATKSSSTPSQAGSAPLSAPPPARAGWLRPISIEPSSAAPPTPSISPLKLGSSQSHTELTTTESALTGERAEPYKKRTRSKKVSLVFFKRGRAATSQDRPQSNPIESSPPSPGGDRPAPESDKRRFFPTKEQRATRQARDLHAVLNGILPSTGAGVVVGGSDEREPPAPQPHPQRRAPASGMGQYKSAVVPHVSRKELRLLKSGLTKPPKARRIVSEVKKLPCPPAHHHERTGGAPPLAQSRARVYIVNPAPTEPDREVDAEPVSGDCNGGMNKMAVPTVGGVLGLAADMTGAFDLLADASGALLREGDQEITPAMDSITVIVYWWGYELALPTGSLHQLGEAHFVAGYTLHLLQAFVLGGGAPELAPFLRAISSYLDLEWKAVKSQDKGRGVVIAATWLVPVALVARPWDFPGPSARQVGARSRA